jgi:hypothetical protein
VVVFSDFNFQPEMIHIYRLASEGNVPETGRYKYDIRID